MPSPKSLMTSNAGSRQLSAVSFLASILRMALPKCLNQSDASNGWSVMRVICVMNSSQCTTTQFSYSWRAAGENAFENTFLRVLWVLLSHTVCRFTTGRERSYHGFLTHFDSLLTTMRMAFESLTERLLGFCTSPQPIICVLDVPA